MILKIAFRFAFALLSCNAFAGVDPFLGVSFKSSGATVARPYQDPLFRWIFPQPMVGADYRIGQGYFKAIGEYNWGSKDNLFGPDVTSKGLSIYGEYQYFVARLNDHEFSLGPSISYNYEINRWSDWQAKGMGLCTSNCGGVDEFHNFWLLPSAAYRFQKILDADFKFGIKMGSRIQRHLSVPNDYGAIRSHGAFKFETKVSWHFMNLFKRSESAAQGRPAAPGFAMFPWPAGRAEGNT